MSDVTLSVNASRFYSHCASSIRRTFAEHIPLYICALVFGIATIVIAIAYRLTLPLEASVAFLELVPKFLLLGIALSALYRLVFLMRQGNGVRPLPDIARWLSGQFLRDDRPGNVFHTLLALMPLMISFAALKNEIPQIHPFAWDQTFMEWSRFLGHGTAPWRLMQPVLGHPPITAALDAIYESWFVMMFGVLFWQAFAARGGSVRMQFLVAFALEWFIGGNVLAAIFSSAGPCFYGHLLVPNPYAAQMQYLHEVDRVFPIMAVKLQDMLWQSYATGSGAVMGISAMPSMHVTSSALMALLGWRVNKWLGAGFTLYTAIIAVAAVHLGWHYTVDSIAGILLALIFWYAAGAIVKFNTQRQAAYAG